MSERDASEGTERRAPPKLTGKEILILILRTYRVSFPYVLLFVLVMLVVTWLITEVVFR